MHERINMEYQKSRDSSSIIRRGYRMEAQGSDKLVNSSILGKAAGDLFMVDGDRGVEGMWGGAVARYSAGGMSHVTRGLWVGVGSVVGRIRGAEVTSLGNLNMPR